MNEETLRKRATKLAKHKYLATLYKTLVLKNVLTAAEFWDEYGKDIDAKQSSLGLIEGMSNGVMSNTIQRETWSLFSVFKDDINAQNEESEEKENSHTKTINLQREQILEIFINLPEVKLCFEKTVPHKFTEKEFWTAFLQSHYFKRETTKNVTSGISDKETAIDQLLKQYTNVIQQQKNANKLVNDEDANGYKSHSNAHSFANQLAQIQAAKNKEVDVEGALQRMKKEVAEARAAKNGTAGDMQQFVDQIDGGNIRGHRKEEEKKNEDVDVEMKDVAAEKNNDEHKPLKRRHFKKKLKTLDPSIDLSKTMASFTEIIEDPGNEESKDMNRDDVQCWFNQVNKHGMMLLYQSLNQRQTASSEQKEDIAEIMNNVPKVQYGQKYEGVHLDENEDEDGDQKMNDNDKQTDNVCMHLYVFSFTLCEMMTVFDQKSEHSQCIFDKIGAFACANDDFIKMGMSVIKINESRGYICSDYTSFV